MKNKHPVLRRFMRRKVSVVAAAVLILFVLIAILGPLVWQVDPLKQSVMKKYGPMTVQHPLGTDNLGRDTLARMIYGARVSLAISFAGVLNRYDELFEKFGLKKENVIAANGFIKNMAHYGEIAEPFNAYFGENPPAGVIVEAPPRQNTPFGPKLEIELALFVATGENPQITRRDVVPGMSRVVEYNGIAWFTGHSARPEFKTLATQSEAVMKRYAELFEQFGYKKENILMEYGYVRDIEQVNDYLGARKVFIDPENPPAGVVVQAKPSGDENQLEVQFIVNLD